jgi:membrane associated rhomboid family serine protease
LLWLAFIIGVNGYLYVSMQGAFAWQLHITGVLAGMAMAPLIAARPFIPESPRKSAKHKPPQTKNAAP